MCAWRCARIPIKAQLCPEGDVLGGCQGWAVSPSTARLKKTLQLPQVTTP